MSGVKKLSAKIIFARHLYFVRVKAGGHFDVGTGMMEKREGRKEMRDLGYTYQFNRVVQGNSFP